MKADLRRRVFPAMTVKRSLFGPVDHQKSRMILKEQMRILDEKHNQRWNFDFSSDKPLSGRYEWTPVESGKTDSCTCLSLRTEDCGMCRLHTPDMTSQTRDSRMDRVILTVKRRLTQNVNQIHINSHISLSQRVHRKRHQTTIPGKKECLFRACGQYTLLLSRSSSI